MPPRLALAALLGLALVSCLDFTSGLEVCRDGGRCPDAPASSGGGSPTGDGAGGGGTGGGAPDFAVSATKSTAVVDAASLPADGVSAAQLVVTVVNQASEPLAGQLVTAVHSGLAQVEPPQRTSGLDGVARFTITSDRATSGAVVTTVNPGGAQVVLAVRPSVDFLRYYALGGVVNGLAGAGLVLAAAGEPDLSVAPDALDFVFANPLAPGAAYSVTVAAQPRAQRCTIDGGTGTIEGADVTSVEVSCVSTWAQIAAGGNHSLGIKTDGTVWTWGSNTMGELGDGTTVPRPSPGRVPLEGGFASVAGGSHHSMAITFDGGLWAWGYNNYGQLGAGSPFTPPRTSPVFVGDGFRAVALGLVYSLLLKDTGALLAVGYNNTGQLGDGTELTKFFPVAVLTDVASVSTGTLHSLALLADGGLLGWGFNGEGATGVADGGTQVLLPTPVPGRFVQVAGAGYHSLGLTAAGDLWGWGTNAEGELGDPSDAGLHLEPTPMATGFSRVAAGFAHGLGLKPDGTLWAWGSCDRGQVGDGCDAGVRAPVLVGQGFVSMAAGDAHSLGLKSDGTLWAWGSNELGQLGVGLDGGLALRPTLVR